MVPSDTTLGALSVRISGGASERQAAPAPIRHDSAARGIQGTCRIDLDTAAEGITRDRDDRDAALVSSRVVKLAIQGTCLCNAVQLGVARLPRQVTQCNCSVCRRYGTLWAYYRRSAVSITAPRGALEDYSRRASGLKFVRCRSCGCVIRWVRSG